MYCMVNITPLTSSCDELAISLNYSNKSNWSKTMVQILLKIEYEATLGGRIETAKKSLEIKQLDNGNVYCVYSYLNFDLNISHDKKYLDKNVIYSYIETLSAITLPAFPEHMMGCDGGFTEIQMGGYDGQSHYRWWSCPPKGWEKLDKITKDILEYCLNEFDEDKY